MAGIGTAPIGSFPIGSPGAGEYRENLSEGFVPAALLRVAERMLSLGDSIDLADALRVVRTEQVIESVVLADLVDEPATIVALVEAVAWAASATHRADARNLVSAAFLPAAIGELVFRIVATESFVLADSVQVGRHEVIAASELLLVTAAATSLAQAREQLVDALVVDALATRGWAYDTIESVEFADAAESLRAQIVAAVEAVEFDALAVDSARFTFLASEGVDFAALASNTAAMFEALTESVVVTAAFVIGNQEYVAWVINTEGANPASTYDAFGFNSFAPWQGRYFGAMADGLYELAGDDDAGADIKAELQGGLATFGTLQMKSLPYAYLHHTAEGQLILQVIAMGDAGKEVFWYELEGRTGNTPREDRTKIDGGIQSVYFGWRLLNQNGEHFSIHSVGFVPVALQRRV